MKTLKIAYLMHGVFYGGATRSLQLMLHSLKGKQVRIYIATSSSRSKAIEGELRNSAAVFEIIELKTISNNQYARENYNDAMKKSELSIDGLKDFVRKHGIDLLHVNSTVFPHILRPLKIEFPNLRIVTHVRELIPRYDDGRLQKYVIDEISNFSDRIICISDNEQVPFRTTNRSVVLPNPFDFEKIHNLVPSLRSKYGIEKKTVLVGMMSHFAPAKGHMLFFETLNSILKLRLEKDFKFVVIGVKNSPQWKLILKKIFLRTDHELKVLKYIRTNNLSANVILVPYVTNPLDYILDLDIFVRPSIASDPWGRDIIEAMALSRPVVATGNSNFYVKNDYTGYLVDVNSPEIFAERIKKLILDEKLREKLGNNAKRIITSMCDITEYGNKVMEIYRSIL